MLERGVALAIVIWFVAAMSLLVSGIVYQAKVDARLAQVHVARAKASAAGDGAIRLHLAQAFAPRDESGAAVSTLQGEYRVGGVEVYVEAMPVAGLIDISTASREVLVALLRLRAAMDPVVAEAVADNVIELRSRKARGAKQAGLSALEDLVRAAGVNRTVVDAIRDVSFVDGRRSRRPGPKIVSPEVAAILTEAYPNRNFGSDMPGGEEDPEEERNSAAVRLTRGKARVDAIVRYGDQTWLRRQWVDFRNSGRSSLPWRIYRTEPVRAVDAGRGRNNRKSDA